MGSAVSAIEKATVEAILKLAQRAGEKLDRAQLTDLLVWAKRRGFLRETVDVFKDDTWREVGHDLWDAIQVGNKEAKSLAVVYRQVRLLIERMGAEAEIELAVNSIFTTAAEKSAAEKPTQAVAAPVHRGPYDYLIPPWEPPESDNQNTPAAPPAVDPAAVPLPEEMEVDEDLSTLLQRQSKLLTQVLSEMKALDKDASAPQIREQYRKAHEAIVNSLKHIDSQIASSQHSEHVFVSPQRRKWILDMVKTRQWDIDTANHFLQSKGGSPLSENELTDICAYHAKNPVPASATPVFDSIAGKVAAWWKGDEKRRGEISTGESSAKGGVPNTAGTVEKDNNDPPIDPTLDMSKRWKGLITNAEVTGDFHFLAAPVIRDHGGGVDWQPLDWGAVIRLQKAVMDYGIDNRLVKRQVEAIVKHQDLVPADIKGIFEFILGPTSYMLFLSKWKERLEVAQVNNLELPVGDPLRTTSLDELMGEGRYVDPRRQAALNPRILAQSKAAALEAFGALPLSAAPRQPYLRIRQGEQESFLSFVDKVKEGIDAAPDIPMHLKDVLVREAIIQNANETCRRLIAMLPASASITQIVEQCSKAPVLVEQEKARIHATALAVALTAAGQQGKGDRGGGRRVRNTCYVCGQPGHFRKACPVQAAKQPNKTALQQGAGFTGLCKRCDKFGHRANECRSKFKKDGTPLLAPPQSGNWRSRVVGAATPSQLPPPLEHSNLLDSSNPLPFPQMPLPQVPQNDALGAIKPQLPAAQESIW